ncbi:zf-HC2 domain-containing protein [Promicromonospora sukumoe]|uniref:zf-HC2 domain-containing protein n=1 Tax=Promicromonospora sukumoe TaxID=88382 RepID=UPI0003A7B32E|nr:zf-HC2 domain-containing protein [Promicromonospora sukumoe]
MTVTSADLSLWAAHRRAVVFTVSRRVPGVDPELAASCGLELLCVELLKQGDLADPLAFWTTAAVEVALRMTQEEEPVVGGPAGEPAALAPVRHALDFEVLNLAMERLPAGEQQLLWDHHVGSRPVSAIADEIGVLPYAAKRRLRRAENRLASTIATAHAGTTADLECRSTRAALHDFVRNRLLPRRRQQVEDHMVGCPGCTRAFVDVRESYWMLRAGAPVLLLGAAAAESGLATGAGAAATGVAAAGAGATGAAATGGAASGAGGWLTSAGVRAAVTARTLLTDPVSLTATVAGGLFVTTAVTTGVAGSIEAAPSFHETGTVSVSTQDRSPAAARNATRSVQEDPTHVPELTGTTSTEYTPPGQAKKDGVPPGLAKSDGVPPGLAKSDGVPPGQAKKETVPPGQAKKDMTPPGQAKKDASPAESKPNIPPGQAKKDVPPGQAKQDGKAKDHTPPGQDRSRSTSTS